MNKFQKFSKILIVGKFYQYCSLKSNCVDFKNIFIGNNIHDSLLQPTYTSRHGIILGKTWKDGLLEEYLRNDLDKNVLANYI